MADQRTPLQNNSLHKWCELFAKQMNDAGLDMRVVLKPEVEIPWSKNTVKEQIWRPIMKVMMEIESTTEMDTVDPTKVLEVIARHMGEKHGVQIPDWPSKESQFNESQGRRAA